MLDFHRIADLAAKQYGTISRAQLTELGMPSTTINRALAAGTLVFMHRGVYRVAGARVTQETHFWAGLHLAGQGAVLARRSAGALWRLEGLERTPPVVVEVSIPADRSRPLHRAIDVCRTRTLVLGKDFGALRGVPCTSLARTVVDLSAVLTPRNLEHAFDSAVRRDEQNRKAIIEAIFRLGFGRPELAPLVTIAERKEDGCTQSWLEDEVRQALREEGIPTPIPQVRLSDAEGDFIGRFDFAWPEQRVAMQVDSWEFHKPHEIFEKDRRQTTQLASIGWKPFPVTYRRLTDDRVKMFNQLRRALGLPVGTYARPRL